MNQGAIAVAGASTGLHGAQRLGPSGGGGDSVLAVPSHSSSGAEDQRGGATPPLPPSPQRPAATAASSGVPAAPPLDAAESGSKIRPRATLPSRLQGYAERHFRFRGWAVPWSGRVVPERRSPDWRQQGDWLQTAVGGEMGLSTHVRLCLFPTFVRYLL